LLDGFRRHYHQFDSSIREAIASESDSTVIARLGDDLDQFGQLVTQHASVFPAEELETLRRSLALMRQDVQLQDWLAWAYGHRSVQGIAEFLGVGRSTVRNALLDYGLSQPQMNPFPARVHQEQVVLQEFLQGDDILLDPEGTASGKLSLIFALQPDLLFLAAVTSFTGPLTVIEDDQLDAAVLDIRAHFPRAGISMVNGMLRQIGIHVSQEKIRQSLLRIDPVRRVFERIRIRRREYKVPGPNALWHHDGQHGNNLHLCLFTCVHNVRIERLWVDVTAQVGSKWAEFFTNLELSHGLDVNSTTHLWLLHQLFLSGLNAELSFFANAWNLHKIQIRNGPNRSPADMFVMDMYVFGVRGSQLAPEEALSEEELEVYGVDWEGLMENSLLTSRTSNNQTDEGYTSWVGRAGPPEHLNTIEVDPP
ncbi:hypothetical protein BV25DRAFT_1766853, partial [Artomyces pyxidatus]